MKCKFIGCLFEQKNDRTWSYVESTDSRKKGAADFNTLDEFHSYKFNRH